MKRNNIGISIAISTLLLAACNGGTEGGGDLSANEKAIIGTWVMTTGTVVSTMIIKEDRTGSSVTTIDAKPYWTSEGTWSVAGDLLTMNSTQCKKLDAASGALVVTDCTVAGVSAATDTTRIRITGNKWTMNSAGSNRMDVIFIKQ